MNLFFCNSFFFLTYLSIEWLWFYFVNFPSKKVRQHFNSRNEAIRVNCLLGKIRCLHEIRQSFRARCVPVGRIVRLVRFPGYFLHHDLWIRSCDCDWFAAEFACKNREGRTDAIVIYSVVFLFERKLFFAAFLLYKNTTKSWHRLWNIGLDWFSLSCRSQWNDHR